MARFGARGVFFKNWPPSLFSKHNGIMQGMQSLKNILMVDPVKSYLQT